MQVCSEYIDASYEVNNATDSRTLYFTQVLTESLRMFYTYAWFETSRVFCNVPDTSW